MHTEFNRVLNVTKWIVPFIVCQIAWILWNGWLPWAMKWPLSLNFTHIYRRSFVQAQSLSLVILVCNMISRDTVYRCWPVYCVCVWCMAAFSLSLYPSLSVVVVWFVSPHMWFRGNEILRRWCQQQWPCHRWQAGNWSSLSSPSLCVVPPPHSYYNR